MSVKITFRDGRPKRCNRGLPNAEDADLAKEHPDFADFMARWRGRYFRFSDRSHNPYNRDVRATLAAIVKVAPEDIDAAIKNLDGKTMACLKDAARVEFRRTNPPTAAIPAGALAVLRVEHGRVIAAARVREWAALAIDQHQKEKGNTRKISGLDKQFAVALVGWWQTLYPDKPMDLPSLSKYAKDLSEIETETTDFLDWAWDLFARVGRTALRGNGEIPLKPVTLIPLLAKAIAESGRRS